MSGNGGRPGEKPDRFKGQVSVVTGGAGRWMVSKERGFATGFVFDLPGGTATY